MAEYIDRAAVFAEVCKGCNIEFDDQPCEPADCRILQWLSTIPTADVVDVGKALEWLQGYTFADIKQAYTNGTVLVPLFRVKQAFEDKAYNGLMEG